MYGSISGVLVRLLLYVLISGFTHSVVYADSCNSCYSNHTQVCTQKCLNFPEEKKARCFKPCLLQHCKSECGYEQSSVDSPSGSYIVDCDYCQRTNAGRCSSECSQKGASCKKICISEACRSSCRLPAPPSSILGSGDGGRKMDCSQCKTASESGCKSSCGTGAGSISCAVACVERKCAEACLID